MQNFDLVYAGFMFLLVLGLLVVLLWFLKNKIGLGTLAPSQKIRVVEVQRLDAKNQVLLLRYRSRALRVGLAPNGFTLLDNSPTEVDDGTDANAGLQPSTPAASFKSQMANLIKPKQ